MPKLIQSLKFSAHEIRENQGLTLSGELPEESWLKQRPEGAALAGALYVELEFSVGGNQILLQGKVTGEWLLCCSRCLMEHRSRFKATLDHTYSMDQDTVDISQELREAVLLEWPQRSLCRPTCAGLCPQCGKNLNEGLCGCSPQKPQNSIWRENAKPKT